MQGRDDQIATIQQKSDEDSELRMLDKTEISGDMQALQSEIAELKKLGLAKDLHIAALESMRSSDNQK